MGEKTKPLFVVVLPAEIIMISMARSLRILVFLLLPTLILTSCRSGISEECQDPLGCQVIQPGATIQVGYLLPLSGDGQAHGEDLLEGLQIAIDDRQGLLLDHPLELIGEDADCTPDGLLAAATRLALQKRLVGILGLRCTHPDEGAIITLSNAGLASLGFNGTPADIPGYFRLAAPSDAPGQAAAQFAYTQLGARRAAALAEPDLASQEALQAFIQTFQAGGGEIIFQQTIAAAESDSPSLLQAPLQTLSANPPDVLFLALSQRPGSAILRQIRSDPAFSAMSIIAGEDLYADSLAVELGASAEGLYLVAPVLNSSAYTTFLQKWTVKYGRPPGSDDHSLAYDAAGLLFGAISQAADRRPDGSLSISRQALRQALGSTGSFLGLSGEISCQPSGECSVDRHYAIYILTEAEIERNRWPPSLVWELP